MAQAAEIPQIEAFLKRKPSELSGGQRQRIAIGRALVRDVDVFLFVEPLSNLDAKLCTDLSLEIKRLHQQVKNTMTYVTHDQIEAMTLGDRIAVMHEGRIQQVGPPLEIYDQPANIFEANFIGSPEMNMSKEELKKANGAMVFYSDEFSIPVGNILSGGIDECSAMLGIRPEHIEIAEGKDMEMGMKGVVDFVEQMGSQTLCQIIVKGVKLKALVDRNDGLQDGMKVDLRPDMTKLHLFNSVTGHNLVFSNKAPVAEIGKS